MFTLLSFFLFIIIIDNYKIIKSFLIDGHNIEMSGQNIRRKMSEKEIHKEFISYERY